MPPRPAPIARSSSRSSKISDPASLPGGARITPDPTAVAVGVVAAARHGRAGVRVAFDGVGDRTAAEALVGARVLVRRADLPAPEPGEFYHHEVVGFAVVTT